MRVKKSSNYWVQRAIKKKGSLSRQLGVPDKENIPSGVLEKISRRKTGTKISFRGRTITVTPLLKKRANLALTLRRFRM